MGDLEEETPEGDSNSDHKKVKRDYLHKKLAQIHSDIERFLIERSRMI